MAKYIFTIIFFIIEHAVLVLSIIYSTLTILILMLIKVVLDIKKLNKEIDECQND